MTVKTSGAQWKKFYSDTSIWPEPDGSSWHEDEEITINGVDVDGETDLTDVDDNARMTIKGGVLYFNEVRQDISLEGMFRRWLRAQNNVILVVESPKELAEAVKTAVAAAGGKVRKS